jgi:hypothetical protein
VTVPAVEARTVAVRTSGARGVLVGLPSASVPETGSRFLLPADLDDGVALLDDVAVPDQHPADRARPGGLDRDRGVGDDRALDGDGVGDRAARDRDHR